MVKKKKNVYEMYVFVIKMAFTGLFMFFVIFVFLYLKIVISVVDFSGIGF